MREYKVIFSTVLIFSALNMIMQLETFAKGNACLHVMKFTTIKKR